MSKGHKKPDFGSLDGMFTAINELMCPPSPYHKQLVTITPHRGKPYQAWVITVDGKRHLSIPNSDRRNTRDIKPVHYSIVKHGFTPGVFKVAFLNEIGDAVLYEKVYNGRYFPNRVCESIMHEFTEWNVGSCYAASAISREMIDGIDNDAETRLNMKIDVDLAVQQGRSVVETLSEYIGERYLRADTDDGARLRRLRKSATRRHLKLVEEQIAGTLEREAGGKEKTTNSADLISRYKGSPEATKWILANQKYLDAAAFEPDDYEDPALNQARQINECDGRLK